MKSLFQPDFCPVVQVIIIVLAAVMLLPQAVLAECKEFKIVEYEDRVEAVCVGEPLTEAQKKANLEDEKRQEAEVQRQRMVAQKRERDSAAADKAQTEAAAAVERKKKNSPPVTPPTSPQTTQQKNINRNSINPRGF